MNGGAIYFLTTHLHDSGGILPTHDDHVRHVSLRSHLPQILSQNPGKNFKPKILSQNPKTRGN
jgi:hypothetical protein